jgi:deazaflavin-dependent oxidoreductase (nitroreductase family)
MLTTVGAKTGKRRHSIVTRFPEPDHPDAWLVVGSNGGSARHPSWCYNLAKNPDQAWITVQAELTKPHRNPSRESNGKRPGGELWQPLPDSAGTR